MIDARAFRSVSRNAIQNFGSPGKVGHGTQSSILLSVSGKVIISYTWEELFSNSIYITVARVLYHLQRRFIVASLRFLTQEGRVYDRFRFRSHSSPSSCHGEWWRRSGPKLLGVGMILYRRYLGITVETSSSADDSLPDPSRFSRPGHRRSCKNGPSSPLPPSSLSPLAYTYLLNSLKSSRYSYPRKYNRTTQRDAKYNRFWRMSLS